MTRAFEGLKTVVVALSAHTGLPALVVASLLLVAARRALRRSLWLVVEIAAIATVLAAATQLGWIVW